MKDVILYVDDDKSIEANRGLALALSYLNSAKLGYISVKVPMLIYDSNLYARIKTVILRNVNTQQSIGIFRQLREHAKNFGFSIAYYYDGLFIHNEECGIIPDYIRDDTAPLTEAHITTAIRIMKNCDYIIVKNDIVARHLKRDAGVQTPIHIFGEYVPQYSFQNRQSMLRRNNILKARIGYVASTNDYSSIGGQSSGFTEEVIKWLSNQLARERWQFYVFYPKGHFPWFLESMRRYTECFMIEVDGVYDVHGKLRLYRPQMLLQPFDDNAFHRMNGDGRLLEGYAAMIPVITNQHDTEMNQSTKDSSILKVKEFTPELLTERISAIIHRDSYNAVIESQYDYLSDNKLWLEDNLPRLVSFL